jgi:hypothetical protein
MMTPGAELILSTGRGGRTPTAWYWSLLVLAGVNGCGVSRELESLPGEAVHTVTLGGKDAPAVDPVELQAKLLRFADAFQTGIVASIGRLRIHGEPADLQTILQWKAAVSSMVISIASGANIRVNLLDLAVIVTLLRLSVESRFRVEEFGESGTLLRKDCRDAEESIWRLSSAVLEPGQKEELRRAIEAWHQSHATLEEILSARAAGFTAEVLKSAPGSSPSSTSEGLLKSLDVDPLSGLDPAVREITQTRLFAERALFVGQKLPVLLRWQTELLGLTLLGTPEVRQVTGAAPKISSSVERLTNVAETLPDRLVKEREALVKALEAQEKTLGPIVRDVRGTVEAGTSMTESLNTTLETFDEVIKRLADAGAFKPSPPSPEPFRIQDYTQAATQLGTTLKQLADTTVTIERLLSSEGIRDLSERVAPVVTRAEGGARNVVDHAFMWALVLVGALLAAALMYRYVSLRLLPRSGKKTS